MKYFNLFDCNCRIGHHLKLKENQPHTRENLLTDMDHFGVTEALVVDPLGRENHPVDGNVRILEVTKGNRRLHPAWVAMPHATPDEQPRGDELVNAMKQHHVGALFFYPMQYRFTLSDWAVDDFVEPIAAEKIPVFIDYNEIGQPFGWDQTDWEAVVAFCRRWPDLPVIVSEFRMRRANRLIYRALEACPNLHIDIGGYWLHRGIEFISENFGVKRLIFGSNWPMHGYADTVATLANADISDDEKRMIGGDNLRNLVAWCEPEHPDVSIPEPDDDYVLLGRSGRRSDTLPPFADNHGHMGGRALHYHLPNCTLEGIVSDIRRLNIDKSIIFSFTGIFSDEEPGNNLVAQAVAAYPDHFVGLTMLNPLRGKDGMIAELERCDKLGLKGIKLIAHYQGYPTEGENIDVACQWAHDRRQIILNHSWGSVAQMRRLLESYPDACFFTGHTTVAYADLMKEHDNLYVCSCPLLAPGECKFVVDTIGADRLMFGSDLQDLPIAWGLGPILFAKIPPEQKRLILGDNLRRILKEYSL